MSRSRWETVGQVAVDSGHILIVDPCNAGMASRKWHAYIRKLDKAGWDLDGRAGRTLAKPTFVIPEGVEVAILVDSFGWDGIYPVEIREVDGRGELRILFRDPLGSGR